MHLRGEYDGVQDRMVLALGGTVSGGNQLLWLTRRQWLAIAMACYSARSDAAAEGEQPARPRKKTADAEAQAGLAKTIAESIGIRRITDGTGDYGAGGGEDVKVDLVYALKFQRIPSGLRIKVTTETGASLFLPLKGENFPLFIELVERLAAKAKWDLPAAISRMKSGGPVRKEFVN